jgi:hypothetical protein
MRVKGGRKLTVNIDELEDFAQRLYELVVVLVSAFEEVAEEGDELVISQRVNVADASLDGIQSLFGLEQLEPESISQGDEIVEGSQGSRSLDNDIRGLLVGGIADTSGPMRSGEYHSYT